MPKVKREKGRAARQKIVVRVCWMCALYTGEKEPSTHVSIHSALRRRGGYRSRRLEREMRRQIRAIYHPHLAHVPEEHIVILKVRNVRTVMVRAVWIHPVIQGGKNHEVYLEVNPGKGNLLLDHRIIMCARRELQKIMILRYPECDPRRMSLRRVHILHV